MRCDGCPYWEIGLSGEWCDKVGGKIAWYGYCGEVEAEEEVVVVFSQKKHNKRERDFRYKLHLKKLSDNCNKRKYKPSPAFPADENGSYVGDDQYYVKHPWAERKEAVYIRKNYKTRGKRSRICKRYSSRKIRRYKGEIKNGWSCHKLYDFWYEIY